MNEAERIEEEKIERDIRFHLEQGDALYFRETLQIHITSKGIPVTKEHSGRVYLMSRERAHASWDGGKTWMNSWVCPGPDVYDVPSYRRWMEEDPKTFWVEKKDLWKYLL